MGWPEVLDQVLTLNIVAGHQDGSKWFVPVCSMFVVPAQKIFSERVHVFMGKQGLARCP